MGRPAALALAPVFPGSSWHWGTATVGTAFLLNGAAFGIPGFWSPEKTDIEWLCSITSEMVLSSGAFSAMFRKGRLDLGMEPKTGWRLATAHHGLTVLSISDGIALASTALPPLHADPSDRIIVATAVTIQAAIVTSDPLIRQYPNIHVIW